MDGTIVRIVEDKGFGFLRADGETTDYFFHYTALLNTRMHQGIVGRKVTFEAMQTPKGLRAESVFVEGV